MPNLIGQLLTPTSFVARNETDPIPAGQTNAALGASAATVVSELLLVVNPELFARVLGENASSATRAALAIGILAAGALIAVADLAARAYASAHRTPTEAPTASATTPAVSPSPGAPIMVTHIMGGRDTSGWQVRSVMADHAIIVKDGESPRWVPLDDIVVEPQLAPV